MHHLPPDIDALLTKFGQRHVLAGWDCLDAERRASLVAQLQHLDFPLLARLYAGREGTTTSPTSFRISPLPGVLPEGEDAEARAIGEQALARGEVAALVVAGGQGSRLGFEHPKGMYPIGPVSRKSLFQLHAEKVLARGRKYGVRIPFLVMTSHATHRETEEFFEQHGFFGLSPEDVYFFRQGTMPALDLKTGRVLLEAPGILFAAPNGHGGTLTAMADSGLLAKLRHAGVRHVYYFQVDNPLVKIADPTFVGQHVRARAEVSSKVVPKETPFDKLGNLVLIDGRLSIIEYSDLPASLAEARNADGSLRIGAGNPAIHVFALDFLERVTADVLAMPYHLARKKVPYWDPASREYVEPAEVNALKFERFIFDVLPLADRWCGAATSHREEFAPLKNGSGPDSPETVRRAIGDLATHWLTQAGAVVAPDVLVEVSALAALEPSDLEIAPGTRIESSREIV